MLPPHSSIPAWRVQWTERLSLSLPPNLMGDLIITNYVLIYFPLISKKGMILK